MFDALLHRWRAAEKTDKCQELRAARQRNKDAAANLQDALREATTSIARGFEK